MTAAQKLIVNIPFPGFYESWLSGEIDHQEEMHCEYEANERDGGEQSYPPELRLTQNEIADVLYRVTQYRDAYLALARCYVDAFNYVARDDYGLNLRLEFETMQSPREYNFTTDRVFCYVPLRVMQGLFALSRRDKHATLSRVIRERFTSYDGFSSFYDNTLCPWLEKPLREWDHNELGTLLIAALELKGANKCDFERAVTECTLEHENGYRAWESAVDWPAYEARIAELRADKLAEWKERDPDHVQFAEPPYRCPLTGDLFAWAREAHS